MLNFSRIKKHRGQGMVEYILVVMVIVGCVFVTYRLFGKKVSDKISGVIRVLDDEAKQS